MHGRYSRFIRTIHFFGDLCLLNISYLLSFLIVYHEDLYLLYTKPFIRFQVNLNLVWIAVAYGTQIYFIKRAAGLEDVIVKMVKALFLLTLLFSFTLFISKSNFPQHFVFYIIALFSLFIIAWRTIFSKLLKLYRRYGFNYRKVVVVGAGPVGSEMYNFFVSDLSAGYKFMGFFDDNIEKCLHKDLVLGNVDSLKEFALREGIDEIYCALPDSAGHKVRELLDFAEKNLIRFRIIPDIKRYIPKKLSIEFYGSVPAILVRQEPLESLLNRATKRTFDIVFSLFVIIAVFSWLFPIIAILIKLTSKGPIFFKQMRSGKNNEEFLCWKFSTMVVNGDADSVQASKDDHRITPVGRFLRRTNLDELPQFINVLIGNMSIVGPRPHMLKHTEQYSKMIDTYIIRHFVKPGITGWAQVNGYRGETRNQLLMQKRIEYDVWYLENWSFLLDMKIIVRTVYNMIAGEENAF
jgi:putative colanic acid biosysnthesis UDP-glucose lipid carrier transferase